MLYNGSISADVSYPDRLRFHGKGTHDDDKFIEAWVERYES